MGIIHAVNPNPPGRIYLATNIHPAVLCRVNCLLTGAVKIPIEMVDEADMVGLRQCQSTFLIRLLILNNIIFYILNKNVNKNICH